MTRFDSWPAWPVLVFAVLAAAGCGTSRQLQSVTLSPASADAQNFAQGQVQFTATGTFNQKPSPVQLGSQDVSWCVGASSGQCAGNIFTGAIVDQNGVARCQAGFAGTATILAGQGKPAAIPDQGSQLKVFGAAQLSCP
jgi:hypothetical protein